MTARRNPLIYVLAAALMALTVAACTQEDTPSDQTDEESTSATATQETAPQASSTPSLPSGFPMPPNAQRAEKSSDGVQYYTVSGMSAAELVNYFATALPSNDFVITRSMNEPKELAPYTRLADWTIEKDGEDYTVQVRSYDDGTVEFTVSD